MKKLKVILGLFFILSMVLAACGTGTNTSATTAPAGTEAVATSAPVATEAVSPAVTETTSVLPGTGETSTAVVPTTEATTVGGLYPTETASATSGLPATGLVARPDFVSFILTMHVQGPNGEDLGKVQDVVLNFCTDRIDYVLLAPGPALGVASGQLIAIPWTSLTISGAGMASMTGTSTPVAPSASMTETATTTAVVGGLANGAYVFVLNTSIARLQGAPTVAQTGLNVSVQGWDQAIMTYWGIAPQAACATMTGTATAEAGMGAAETSTPAAGAGAGVSLSVTATGVTASGQYAEVLATQFLGSTLNGDTGTSIGIVQDVEVGIATGQIRYVVVVPDASLNLGTGKVMFIPAAVVRSQAASANPPVFMVTVSQDVLMKAPTFDQANLPDTTTSTWDSALATYWAQYISGTH